MIGLSKPMVGATGVFSGGISNLVPNGFEVGSDARVNASGVTYYYFAVATNGVGDFTSVSYLGTGVEREIELTGVNSIASLVIVMPETAAATQWYSAAHSGTSVAGGGGNSGGFATITAANRIENLLAGADALMKIGTDASVNGSGVAYHVIAFKDRTELFKTTPYVGNLTAGRSISAGFAPSFAFVCAPNLALPAVARFSPEAAGLSVKVDGSSPATNMIQSFTDDGIVIGSSSLVNEATGFVAVMVKAGESLESQLCGAIDVVFVLDRTGSVAKFWVAVIEALKSTAYAISIASSGECRFALITFTDEITVDVPFSGNNVNDIAASLSAYVIPPTGVGGSNPEPSDFAAELAAGMPFDPSSVRDLVILVTDAPPGGNDDAYDETDRLHALEVAQNAAALGVQITAIQLTHLDAAFALEDAETAQVMSTYASTTGGIYIAVSEASSSEFNGAALALLFNPIVTECGGPIPPPSHNLRRLIWGHVA